MFFGSSLVTRCSTISVTVAVTAAVALLISNYITLAPHMVILLDYSLLKPGLIVGCHDPTVDVVLLDLS